MDSILGTIIALSTLALAVALLGVGAFVAFHVILYIALPLIAVAAFAFMAWACFQKLKEICTS